MKSENVPNETDQIRNKSNGEIRVKKQKRKLDPSTDNHVEKKKKKLSKSLTVKKLLEEKRIADASPGKYPFIYSIITFINLLAVLVISASSRLNGKS